MNDRIEFDKITSLEKEKALVPFILKTLQQAGGQLERSEIRERICADNDDIANFASIRKISKKTNVEWSEFLYKFNFALKNLMIAGFIEYRRGNPMVALTKKGLDLQINDLDVDRDVYNVSASYWENKKDERISDDEVKEDVGQEEIQNDEFKEKLLDAISKMSPKKFEMFSRQLLSKMGVEFTNIGVQVSNDGGIDGYGYHRDSDDFRTTRVVIQCKRYNAGSVGSQEIDMFLGAMSKFQADYGIFITNSRFTTSAVEAARSGKPITLINGTDLVNLVIRYQLHIKPIQTYELLDFYDIEE
jgi:restriction system protein